ncbi:MAG: DUF1824 family protein [Cyanobacteria bacterium CRU_2_1]|nr:DUF1824 family protein [Cyanobacteria bacterium RU_5_0]NJR58281.1 DUF1824 family protein [Cyanobacteria bacterium CRU_2_1]
MSTSDSLALTEEAHLLLKQIDCLDPAVPKTASEREQLRQALQIVANHSDYQMLGVCADTVAEGVQALKTYAEALGYTIDLNLEAIEGAVYIKFNSKSGSCYVKPYTGQHRGVLVSCQSDDASGLNEMYGHLPLDLFITISNE